MIDVTNFDTALADYGVPCTLGAGTFFAFHDDAYADPLGIAGSQPVLLAYSSAVTGAAIGDAVTVDGTAYTIAAIEPDGTGMTRLRLTES